MATLILFRHAKAALALPGQRDFDRPLTERGRRDADRLGTVLAHYRIDLALVSAAARTQETWQIAAARLAAPPHAEIDRELYLPASQKLVRRLRDIPESVRTPIVIGHNPGMQEVALWLAGDNDSRDARHMRQKFPTAAAAIFDLDLAGWSEIDPRRARLRRFVVPGELEA